MCGGGEGVMSVGADILPTITMISGPCPYPPPTTCMGQTHTGLTTPLGCLVRGGGTPY